MTFSIAARCPESGAFGIAITTSSLAVGSRCAFVRAGVGAFLTQHRTDPRLGPRGIDCLARGMSAAEAMAEVVAGAANVGWRQLAAVDGAGRTACHHGDRIYSIYAEVRGEGCIALGNIVANAGVPAAMVAGYEGAAGASFAERLIAALEAGLDAGGEVLDLRSAALLVVANDEFPLFDLRIDHADTPVAELRSLWALYEPEAAGFPRRVHDPDSVPPDPRFTKAAAGSR